MWEYKRMDVKFSHLTELMEILNKEGQENWEIIFYNEIRPERFGLHYVANVLFKRPK